MPFKCPTVTVIFEAINWNLVLSSTSSLITAPMRPRGTNETEGLPIRSYSPPIRSHSQFHCCTDDDDDDPDPVWPDGCIICSIFGHLQSWKLAQWQKRIAKVGSNFCQTINKPLQNRPKLFKYWHDCTISPNLVTLRRRRRRWS